MKKLYFLKHSSINSKCQFVCLGVLLKYWSGCSGGRGLAVPKGRF